MDTAITNMLNKLLSAVMLLLLIFSVSCNAASIIDSELAYAADESSLEEGKEDGSGGHYMDINLFSIGQDGELESKGGTASIMIEKVLQPIVSGVMLPIAIVLVAWRTVYIAIFPMMARVDPLDMLSTDRYSGVGSGGGRGARRGGRGGARAGGGNLDNASGALKQEVKSMVIGLAVIAAVWTILQIAMWVAVMLLGSFGGAV